MIEAPRTGMAIDLLKDDTGMFAMLAIDQRESLRTMITQGLGGTPLDEDLSNFKRLASAILTPSATAVLIDREFGLAAAAVSKCPIILAADTLHQMPGGPVTATSLDHGVTPALIAEVGARALKVLVLWTPGTRDEAIDLAERFMALCHTTGLPGIVEGVVRAVDIATWPDQDRNDALVAAAKDFSSVAPDLYKCEVPSYGRGDASAIRETSRHITDALDCEWVVLSSGVTAADFPSAVRACVEGGASGFLAGRAVWADALSSGDIRAFLETTSIERMQMLAAAAHSGR